MSKNPITEAPQIIATFLGYMQTIKGKSQKTISEYYFDLRTFFRFIKIKKGLISDDKIPFERISIDDIDIDLIKTITLTDVFEYMNYTISDRKNSPVTRSRKSSSLRMFFKFLTNKTHQLEVNPIEELDTPKIKKTLPKYLTLEQSKELLNSVDGEFMKRDYCILTLFLNCGLRLAELVGLNCSDVYPNGTIRVTGKGNKERIVYLNEACTNSIKEYLKVRPVNSLKTNDDKKALFISRLNKRMGRQAVQLMVNKYLNKIGLSSQGYSVHKLRHTAATLLYQYGEVDIRTLQDILGHENLGTTEIYTHLSSKQMAQAAKASPLANMKKEK